MRLVIMCKAPVPGRVKTRLMPQYSAGDAARLHAAMAETVIRRASRLFSDVIVAADDPSHSFFSRFSVPVLPQGQGGLGDRLARMLEQLWDADRGGMMFLGTDSPHMPAERLLAAADLIKTKDAVFGPVEDGGYDLLAVSGRYPALFDGIDWGTSEVLRQSVDRAARLSLRVGFLDISFDVDSATDLRRACEAGWHCPAELAGILPQALSAKMTS